MANTRRWGRALGVTALAGLLCGGCGYQLVSAAVAVAYRGTLPEGTRSNTPSTRASNATTSNATPSRSAPSEAPGRPLSYQSVSERALMMMGHDCEAQVELSRRCYVASVEPTQCVDLRDMMVELARQANLAADQPSRIGAMCASVCERRYGGAEWSSVSREVRGACGDGPLTLRDTPLR